MWRQHGLRQSVVVEVVAVLNQSRMFNVLDCRLSHPLLMCLRCRAQIDGTKNMESVYDDITTALNKYVGEKFAATEEAATA